MKIVALGFSAMKQTIEPQILNYVKDNQSDSFESVSFGEKCCH